MSCRLASGARPSVAPRRLLADEERDERTLLGLRREFACGNRSFEDALYESPEIDALVKDYLRAILGQPTQGEDRELRQRKIDNARWRRGIRDETEKAARLYVRANLYAGRNRPERQRATQRICCVPRPRSELSGPRRARGCGPRRQRRCSSSSTRDSSGGDTGPAEAGLTRTAQIGLGVAATAEWSADSPSIKTRRRPQKPRPDRRCEVCEAVACPPGESECGPCREFAALRAEVERSGIDPFDSMSRR